MPKIAVIARVGAHKAFAAAGAKEAEALKVETPFGPSNPIHIFRHGSADFAVVSRHGEESYSMNAPSLPVRNYIWALKDAGVERIISWSAPGAINLAMAPGDLVVPHDVIDETKSRVNSFYIGKGVGFIRQSPVFCPELRDAFLKNSKMREYPLHDGGVYVCTEGPRLETPAEIRKYKILGGDLVGETLCPEVFLARELEICYAAINYVVNFAEGIKEAPLRTGVLFEGLLDDEDFPRVERVERDFPHIVLSIIEDVAKIERKCQCGSLMLRYRMRGDISDDWRRWVSPGS